MKTAVIIALIEAAAKVIKHAPDWIQEAKARGELSPEEEAQLDKRIAELPDKPHWKLGHE